MKADKIMDIQYTQLPRKNIYACDKVYQYKVKSMASKRTANLKHAYHQAYRNK